MDWLLEGEKESNRTNSKIKPESSHPVQCHAVYLFQWGVYGVVMTVYILDCFNNECTFKELKKDKTCWHQLILRVSISGSVSSNITVQICTACSVVKKNSHYLVVFPSLAQSNLQGLSHFVFFFRSKNLQKPYFQKENMVPVTNTNLYNNSSKRSPNLPS